MESERSSWVLKKPYAPAFGFKKHAFFTPAGQKDARFQTSLSSPFWKGTVPAQPSNGFFPPRSLRRVWVLITLGQSLHVFDALSLIYSTSWYDGFGDASSYALNTIFSRIIINAGFSILKISFTIFCALMFSCTEWIK